MSGSKNTRKTDGAKATDSNATSPDTAALMAAIANSEKNVVAKISTLEAKVETKCQALNELIDSLRSNVSDQTDEVRTELCAKIDALATTFTDHHSRLTSLEEDANTYSDRVVDLEKQVHDLKEVVSALLDKTEDLEGRQRRCNIRILGVREHFETGTRPVTSVAQLLKEVLALDTAPTLDRAHRSLQPVPVRDQRPRPLIVKFHYFQEKEEVLRRAALNSPLTHNGDRILIFPNLPSAVAKRGGAFKEAKDLLRGCRAVRFGMLYPAKLRISSPLGEEIFTNPTAAKDYVKNPATLNQVSLLIQMKNFHPRLQNNSLSDPLEKTIV
uniref:L1 transposable element RRM domain-containing protein n=1 Tax=Pundamilia nyererei TaxID=303518 RepID=A0A3B4GU76_9CICH